MLSLGETKPSLGSTTEPRLTEESIMIKKKRSPPKKASLTKKRGKEAVGERGSKERIALRSFLNGDLSSTSMLEKSIPRLNEKSKKKKRSQGSNSSINSKSMLEKPIIDVVVENTGG